MKTTSVNVDRHNIIRIRRIIRHVVVYGVIGTTLTIGVAWTCIAFPTTGRSWNAFTPSAWSDEEVWLAFERDNVAASRVLWHPIQRRAAASVALEIEIPWCRTPRRETKPLFDYTIEDARGWPCLALASETECREIQGATAIQITSGLQWPSLDRSTTIGSSSQASFEELRILGLRILPFGFVADSLIYGLAAYVLTCCVGVIQRRRERTRRWLGRCSACDYRLVDRSAPCPECGARR